MAVRRIESVEVQLTTHPTGARVSLSFIVNLNLPALSARPVNCRVRRFAVTKH
jgi:hypothetical protein